jgi:tetratricopeptide (TPR) repeat protein
VDGDVFVQRAYRYIYENDFAKAIAAFKKAISCDPGNPEYYFLLSVTFLRSGFPVDAERAANRAVTLDPENEIYRSQRNHAASRVRFLEALLCLSSDREPDDSLSKAIGHLTVSVQLDPLFAEGWLWLGSAQEQAKNWLAALQSYMEALRLSPGLPFLEESIRRVKEKVLFHRGNELAESSDVPPA